MKERSEDLKSLTNTQSLHDDQRTEELIEQMGLGSIKNERGNKGKEIGLRNLNRSSNNQVSGPNGNVSKSISVPPSLEPVLRNTNVETKGTKEAHEERNNDRVEEDQIGEDKKITEVKDIDQEFDEEEVIKTWQIGMNESRIICSG